MDFPLKLKDNFAVSQEEFNQVLTLIFKEQIGSFLQSVSLGHTFSLQTDDAAQFQLALEHTLEQIGNVSLESCTINSDVVYLSVKYRDRIENFTFEVTTNEN